MLMSVALKFQAKYGGDLEEWKSEGHVIFMRAWNTYNPQKKFSTWYYFLLCKLYMEKIRRAAMRSARCKQVEFDLTAWPERNSRYSFISELSEDAKLVVGLVLDSPNEIKLTLLGTKRRTLVESMKAAMYEFLEDLGWESGRIEGSFEEVREALAC